MKNEVTVFSDIGEVFGNVKKEEYDKPKCPRPPHKIKIERQALEKLFIMAEEMKNAYGKNLEVYALLVGHDDIVTDIVIPPQTVSYTHISISESAILKTAESIRPYLDENGLKILGWGHSHCDFAVFFSGTDDKNQKNLFYETANYIIAPYEKRGMKIKFSYGITVNVHRETYGEVTSQFPCGSVFTEKNAEFDVIGDLPDDWEEELMRKVIRFDLKNFVKPPHRRSPRSYYQYHRTQYRESEYGEAAYKERQYEEEEGEEEEQYEEEEDIGEEESDYEEIDEERTEEIIDAFLKNYIDDPDPEDVDDIKQILRDFAQYLVDVGERFP